MDRIDLSKMWGMGSALAPHETREWHLAVKLATGKRPAGDVLNKGLLDGMEKIGKRFKANEVYIPEVLIAACAMNQSMEILKPELVKAGVKPIGKMLLGTVKGDLHDIGKNLVKMMGQGAGIEVVDLGIDVSADKFVQGLRDNADAKAVGMSALLTTTMTGMKEVIDRFEKEGLRKKVKFMAGGAPLTDAYAKEIGADGYAPDAASAAEKFKAFLSQGRSAGPHEEAFTLHRRRAKMQ
jgi:5-methyltetrahydrofolate--homocysteine methyltransferase